MYKVQHKITKLFITKSTNPVYCRWSKRGKRWINNPTSYFKDGVEINSVFVPFEDLEIIKV